MAVRLGGWVGRGKCRRGWGGGGGYDVGAH